MLIKIENLKLHISFTQTKNQIIVRIYFKHDLKDSEEINKDISGKIKEELCK